MKRKSLFLSTLFAAATLSTSTLAPLAVTSAVVATSAVMTPNALGAISTYDSTNHKIIWANTNANAVFKYVGEAGTNITFNTPANWNKGSTSNGTVTFPETAVTGNPGRVNGGYLLYFDGENKTMTFNGNGGDSSDGGGIWVSGKNNNVTVSLGGWAGSIQVDAENVLNTSWNAQLKDGHIVANGTVNITSGNLNFDGSGTRSWYTGDAGAINVKTATGLSAGSIEILGSGKTTFSKLTSIASGQSIEVKNTAKVDFGGQTVGGSGVLKLNAGTTLGNITLGALTLDLTALTLDNSTPKVNLDGSVSFTENSVIKLGNVTAGGTYKIFDAGVTSADSLTYKNFSSDSVAIGGRSVITNSNGALSITLGTVYSDLVWAGVENAVWNTTAENKVWNRTSDASETKYDFANGDSVTFSTVGATVTVEGTVDPKAVTVSENTTFTGTGTINLATAANLTMSAKTTINQNVVLNVGDVTASKVDFSNLAGTGTFKFNGANTNHTSGVNLGSDFTGTVEISGNANLPKHTELGGAKKVVINNAYLWTGETKEYSQEFVFSGQYTNPANEGNAKQRGNGNITYKGAVTLKAGSSFGFEQGTTTFAGSFTGEAGSTLYLGASGSTTNFSGETTIDTLNISGGTTNFTGVSATLGTLKVTGGSTAVVFGSSAEGAAPANYTITGEIQQADNNGTNRTFTIHKNATVTASALRNSWGVKTLTVDGVLNLTGEGLLYSSGDMTNTITGTGTINTKKFTVNNVGTYVLDGGININIGSGGITQNQPLQIKDATIGASANWTSSSTGIKLGENAKFNTNGHTITLGSALEGISGVAGKITKLGAGTLVLNAANTFSGGVAINAGTLRANHASALGTGVVTIAGGATLDVSALTDSLNIGNLTTSNGAILNLGAANATAAKIVSTGTVSLDAGTIFDIASIANGLKLISGTELSAEGLGIANLLVDGKLVNQRGTATFAVSDDVLTLTNYTAGANATLTWAGDATGTWTLNGGRWTADGFENPTFQYGDSVIFNTDGLNLTLNETVSVGAMTVNENMTLTGAGTVLVDHANLTIGADKKLTINENITLNLGTGVNGETSKNISGAGTILFASVGDTTDSGGGNSTSSVLKLASDFSGKVSLTSGVLYTGSSVLGTATVNLNGGGILLAKSNETKTLSNNITVGESGGVIRLYGSGTGTISGSVSGTGRLSHTDGGTLTFTGTVDVGTFRAARGTTNFSGNTTLDTLYYEGGSALNFSQNSISTVGAFSATGAHSMGIAGVLNITGNKTGVSQDTASFMMANGGGKNTITIQDGGVLNLASAGLSVRDGEAELNIATGGEANFGKGLHLVANSGSWGANVLNLNGGTLNVGSSGTGAGITTDGKRNVKVNLNSGTLGSLADSWSSSLDFVLGGQITVDTTKKQISNSGKATEVSGQTGSTVTLSGVLSNATDATASLTKTGLGTLILSGANTFSGGVAINAGTLVAKNDTALGTGTATIADGATLELGDGAGTLANAMTFANNAKLSLAADATLSGALTLNGALNVASNSAKTVTLSGAISGNGGFNIDNSATVKLTGTTATTISGNVTGTGKLQLASGTTTTFNGGENNTLILGANVAVESGATLNLGGTIEIQNAIQNAGTITLGSGIVFNLNSNVPAGTNYTFNLISGGTINGIEWNALTKDNFTYNGDAMDRFDINVGTAGTVVLTSTDCVWNGSNGNWSDSNAWTYGGSATNWKDSKNAVFQTTNASVTIGSAVTAANVYIEENTTITGIANLTLGEGKSIVISNEKTLTLGGNALAGLTKNVTGTGTLKLELSNVWNNTIKLNSGTDGATSAFAGTLHITGGKFTINNSNIGTAKYVLDGNTGFQVSGSAATIANAITFTGGTHEFHTNKGANLTLTGDFTVESGTTVAKKGDAVFAIQGNAKIDGTFTRSVGTVNITLGADKMFVVGNGGSFSINGAVTNNGKMDIAGTFSTSGKVTTAGTLTVSGAFATTGEFEQTNGTVNFENGANVTLGSYKGPSSQGGGINSVLNISSGATVSTTGDFVLRHQGQGTSTLDLAGTLTVGGNLMLSRDGNGTVNINDGGKLVVSGKLGFGQNWDGTNKSSIVNLKTGGTLVVGANGVGTSFNNLNSSSFNLAGGTLGTSADSMTVAANIPVALVENTNTTINTAKYASGAFGSAGATITIESVISGAGALTKDGAGTLVLSGTNTFTGGLTISNGAVNAMNAGALGAGTVMINTNGTLNVLADGTALNNITETSAGTLNIGAANTAVTATRNYTSGGQGLGLGKVTVAEGSTLALVLAGNRWGVSFSGLHGTLDVSGGANLIFAESETLSGATLNVAAGTQIFGYKSLNLAGVTIKGDGTLNTNNNNSDPGAAAVTLTGDNKILVTNISGAAESSLTVSSGTTTIASNMSAFEGTLKVESGATIKPTGTIAFGGTAVFNGTIDNVGKTALFDIPTSKSVSFGSNVKFNLSELDDGETTFTVFSGTLDNLTGWNSLNKNNVTLNGSVLGSRMEADFSTAGQIVISADLLELVWNGGTSPTVWKSNDSTSEIWNKKDASPTEATYFVSGDSVIFNSYANLTIETGSTISVGTLTLNQGTDVYLTNNGTLVTKGGITIDNGVLAIKGTTKEYTNKTTFSSSNGRLKLKGEKTINAEISGDGFIDLRGSVNLGGNANLSEFTGKFAVLAGATLTLDADRVKKAEIRFANPTSKLSITAEDEMTLSSKLFSDDMDDGVVAGTGTNSLIFAGDLSRFYGTVNDFSNLTFATDNTLNATFNATKAIDVTGAITLGEKATLTAGTLAITGTTEKAASLTLNSGTQLDTITGGITLTHGKLSGVTLAANKTIVANAGAALENVTLAENSTLTVAQNGGSLTFTGTNTLAGTLEVFNSVDGNAMITVASGTTDITKATFNLKLSELSLPESKGETLTYNIFSTANEATLSGWENLTKDNIGEIFSVEGVNINDAHINLGFVESGKINVTLKSVDLVYAGGDDGVWNVRGKAGWTGNGGNTVFFQLDNVTFAEAAEVKVAGTTLVNEMTVNENLKLTNLGANGSLQASGGLVLDSGKELTLTLGGNGAALTGTTISAEKNSTVVVDTNNNDATWSTAFAGTTLNGTEIVLTKQGAGTLVLDANIGSVERVNIANGTLALAMIGGATETIFDKTITGAGTLAKVGAGTVVISNQNLLFTGETQINGGALKLTNADAIGAGKLTINADGEAILVFTTGEFKNIVEGKGKLTIDVGVGGKMNLSSNNRGFEGTLNVASGTAIASNTKSLGENTNIASGAILEVTAAELSSKFTGEGTLNVISESGKTVKMSGNFDGFAGTFNVGNGEKSGALEVAHSLNAKINVNLDSTLIFNIAEDETATFGKAIRTTNQSALKKQGAGTLVLSSQDNKILADEITVEGGTLKVVGANAIGNSNTKITLANDTTFEFVALPSPARAMPAFAALSVPTATETFANSVSGTGKTVFSGGGVVNVTGQNEATGVVDVVGGTTIVTNGMNNVGTGAVNIGENGAWYARNHNVVIGGNGVAGVTMGASGSLHIGSATFTGTALNNLEINATGTEINIEINSLSDLNRVHASGGSIDFTGTIVIETAAGIDLNGKAITLFDGTVALRGEQTIVVNGEAGIYNMISNGTNIVLSTSAIAESFNLGYSSMVAMSRDVFGQDEKSLHNRMEARRFETRELGNTEFFAQMQGSTIDNGKDTKKSGRFDYNTYGALVGGDIRIATGTIVGFALGYDHGKADVHDNQGKIEMDNYRVTAFASQIVGNYAYVEGGISAGTASYELTRSQSNVRESLNGYNIGAFARLGAVVPVTSAFSFLPYAGLSTYYTTMEDFKDGVYDVDSADAISLQARVGASLRYDFAFSAANKSSITFDIAYACELADDELETEAKMGTTNFKRKEIIDNDNFVSVGAEFSTTIGNGASVFMGYSVDIGEDTVHHANAGLRYKF